MELIRASSLLSAEVEEPYYTVELAEAQGGRVTGPRLQSMSVAVQGRNLGSHGKVITHYSLTLRGTVITLQPLVLYHQSSGTPGWSRRCAVGSPLALESPMALGCAVREPDQAPEHSGTKRQQAGAGLQRQPPLRLHALLRYFTGWRRGGNEAR